MKMVLKNSQTEFDLSHINVVKSRIGDDPDMENVQSRIDIVFGKDVTFDSVSDTDESEFSDFSVQSKDQQTQEYTGYEFNTLNQYIADGSSSITLTLLKKNKEV